MKYYRNHLTYIFALLTASLFGLLTGCGNEESQFHDTMNITLPVDTLDAVLQIGREIGDSTETFGSILTARIDQQDRILVLDEISACIKVYDMQGNFIQQLSRRGNGPGELMHPQGMFIMPDGRIAVTEPNRNGFVVFSESLAFQEEVGLWAENPPYQVTPITDDLILGCRFEGSQDPEVTRHTVAIYPWGEGEYTDLLWKDSLVISDAEFYRDPSPFYVFAWFDLYSPGGDSEGNTYFAPVDPFEYRVMGWDSTGTEILNFTREIAPVAKTDEELEYEIAYVDDYFRLRGGSPLPFEFQPAPYKNTIRDVGIGPDQNLWVRRGAYTELFFDIYDLRGNLIRHAIYPVSSFSWQTEITPRGILAWELDPLDGYQKLYLIGL